MMNNKIIIKPAEGTASYEAAKTNEEIIKQKYVSENMNINLDSDLKFNLHDISYIHNLQSCLTEILDLALIFEFNIRREDYSSARFIRRKHFYKNEKLFLSILFTNLLSVSELLKYLIHLDVLIHGEGIDCIDYQLFNCCLNDLSQLNLLINDKEERRNNGLYSNKIESWCHNELKVLSKPINVFIENIKKVNLKN